ncbi:hypothetical protein AYO21_06053 [Fonsecaea monophora]|uniref:Zn(2)-C6 fungal-type domain-containing protein n=1 Tax=Fonsecaea monophora TaxID=254056 RepID=A0A177F6D7_9EURO|nr:hypothetical protein AYO21_06053 [Fonsecaea monophora]OAG39778.1 hypothetical protein AYO21_06053 [Fonsecaea monophora]
MGSRDPSPAELQLHPQAGSTTTNQDSERPSAQPQHPQQEPGQEEDEPQTGPKDAIQPRVCVTCRRRKVKCDKRQPCQNCVKTRTECVFPFKKSAVERQTAADAELLHELRRLEPLFQSLVSKINDDGAGAVERSLQAITSAAMEAAAPPPLPHPPPPPVIVEQPIPRAIAHPIEPPANSPMILDLPSLHGSPMTINSMSGSETTPWSPYGTTVGKLVKDSGRHRYISGLFWDSLHTEDDDSLSDSASDTSDDPAADDLVDDQLYLGHAPTGRSDLRSRHPPQQHRFRAWQLFQENVQPLAPILHLPTVGPLVVEALKSADERPLPPRIEPLIFVIYYAAVTSLTPEATRQEFDADQAILLKRYRVGLQGALSRAKLLDTDEILVLQAFVLFLIILRPHDPSLSWNLTGLAVRLAQSRGMHRDGSFLKLSKFDSEMRRRVWWHICLLDAASSEDHACTPTTLEISSFDAALPCRVNDCDLFPDMTEYPPEREGFVDSCFANARYRFADIWRTVIDKRRPAGADGKSFASMTMPEKVSWVEDQRQKLENEFLHSTPNDHPLQWVTGTIVKLLICNLRLFVYNPLSQNNLLTEEERITAFVEAVAALEHSYSLRTDPRARKWAWLLSCYHEWFALAVALAEMCSYPLRDHVERAWRIVEQSVVLRWNSSRDHRRAHQWRSIIKSLDKARAERKKARKRRRSTSSSQAITRTAKIAKYAAHPSIAPPSAQNALQVAHGSDSTAQTLVQRPDSIGLGDVDIHEGGPFGTSNMLHFDADLPDDSQTMDPFLGTDFDPSFLDMRSFENLLHTPQAAGSHYRDPG